MFHGLGVLQCLGLGLRVSGFRERRLDGFKL